MNLFSDIALIQNGWEKNVRITIDNFGKIKNVESGIKRKKGDQYLRNRVLLPALSNLHSHSFQRAISGLTENRLEKQDSFWSWRDLMHKFVLSLTPEKIEAIAALTYIEMLECGFSSVGEFHYVHNQIDGSNYSDIAETSYSIIRAAIETGIGLTILPVFYVGDILNDGKPSKGQIRFFNNEEQYLKIIYKTEKALIKAPCDYSIGIAPHSLRAIPIELLKEIVNIRFNGPIHIHVAEQNKEVELIKSNFGARPVEWLLNNFNINSRWCLIHATHMNQKETKDLSDTGAVVGLCPVTEANLGDGIFDGKGLILSGGKYGIGSDSNIRISLTEELRMLEYSQRLIRNERNLMINESGSVGYSLFKYALDGGSQALDRKSGNIVVGNWADLLTLDSSALNLWDCVGDEYLDRWIFSGDDKLVCDVWSAGRRMVVNGKHIFRAKVENRYRSIIRDIRGKN